ncbi:hypothetical protein A8H39_31185 [Paraburkholderia fungorum]|jgi:hypothetical protein|uniref:hypothetical protein n=1 Tax=Paraburkholderia fungorum TaxID=134537 RepID=UPI000486E8D8|nr:hypothetical protein [Paraburkholderia fungorum]MBB5539889.1 hypothetical protein [Paraburkholderia fungorum]PNE53104.1 hypothetical protein A8H39_31185 [Paraburkholderia fungorum]PZR49761.1 MAG: hypothetical protein DI523_06605 [Paraburkholderia fungorum]
MDPEVISRILGITARAYGLLQGAGDPDAAPRASPVRYAPALGDAMRTTQARHDRNAQAASQDLTYRYPFYA